MDFVTLEENEFTHGVADEILPGIRRVIAYNPSKFTYRGTGVYILGTGDDVAVIDPGPDLDDHRSALATALEGYAVRSIPVTHCHADHSPLAAWLKTESDAPTYAWGPHASSVEEWEIGGLPDDFGRPPDPEPGSPEAEAAAAEPKVEESTDTDFVPDVEVRTGDEVFRTDDMVLTAIHTPGHTSNHVCYALESDAAGRVLFTGDHVMGWSTTVVSPPDGSMGDYIESLRLVAGRGDDVAIPTHGAPIRTPGTFISDLVDHRLAREAGVLGAVQRGLTFIPDMVTELYAATWIGLYRPAAASVLGHMVKLVNDGLVACDTELPRLDSTYQPV